MWLALWIATFSGAVVAASADEAEETATVAHFALIRPEADPANEDTPLSPGASWLRRPKAVGKKTGPVAAGKPSRGKPKDEKPAATVKPLRRERPKNEVDPPKTRRRPLGW
jgi:hypothetical protein